MRLTLRGILGVAGFAAWVAAVGYGGARMWRYDTAAGAPARAPARMPAEAGALRTHGLPALVISLHPHCSCSRATIDELAKIMTDCRGKLRATVLVLAPRNMPDAWVRSDLWASAAAIPGVTVIADRDGAESQRLGAATSGQALLYGADGKLLFAGGITESRGHAGDNAGESAITALVLGQAAPLAAPAHTPVYGCPLFDVAPDGRVEANKTCRR